MDLELLKKLCSEATPGPWRYGWFLGGVGTVFQAAGNGDRIKDIAETFGDKNTEFIAAARTVLPELIARVEKLEEALRWYADRDNGLFRFSGGGMGITREGVVEKARKALSIDKAGEGEK